MSNQEQSNTLNLGELSNYLGWTPRFIEGLVRGELLPAELHDGQLRFERASIVAWLQEKVANLAPDQIDEADRGLESSLLSEGQYRTERDDRLSARLQPESILLDLPVYSRGGVLRELVGLADRSGLVTDSESLHNALLHRESISSTAVGDGVAFVHPTHPLPHAITRDFLCFLRSATPIDFGDEQSGTHLFFLLCATDHRSHLHAIARLSRILHQDGAAELADVRSPEEFLEVFTRRERNIHQLH